MGARGAKADRLPKVRQLEAIAAEAGYEPAAVSLMFFGENQQRIMGWYEDLKRGIVPADFGGTMQAIEGGSPKAALAEAWNRFYAEAADFMQAEERWMEYFHGKRQRIESTVLLEDGKPEASDEPYSDEDWEAEHCVAPSTGAAKGAA